MIMRRRMLKFGSVAVVIVVGAIGFQNCGKAGFDSGEASGISIASSASDPFPFAFDAKFDQLAYNSCFGVGVTNRPGFFTILAGAYGTGAGVQVTSAFMTYARTSGQIKPDPSVGSITQTQIKMALASSYLNQESVPQMAIRTRGVPQQVRTPNAASPAEGIDFISMLGDLTDDRWMDPLIKRENVPTQFFDLGPTQMRNLEAKISYNKDEGLAQGMRDDLTLNSQVALTFRARADLGDPSAARQVNLATPDPRRVYGRGYNLNFQPALAPYTYLYSHASYSPYMLSPNNVLTEIQEVDLSDTTKPAVNWSCNPNLRYVIVRTVDHPNATLGEFCPRDPFSYMINGIPSKGITAQAYRAEYEIMRRSLKAEFWDISVEFKCAVPKINSGECYPPETGAAAAFGIEYDQTQPCYQALPGLPYTNPVPTKRCAQYVSVCTRP